MPSWSVSQRQRTGVSLLPQGTSSSFSFEKQNNRWQQYIAGLPTAEKAAANQEYSDFDTGEDAFTIVLDHGREALDTLQAAIDDETSQTGTEQLLQNLNSIHSKSVTTPSEKSNRLWFLIQQIQLLIQWRQLIQPTTPLSITCGARSQLRRAALAFKPIAHSSPQSFCKTSQQQEYDRANAFRHFLSTFPSHILLFSLNSAFSDSSYAFRLKKPQDTGLLAGLMPA
ncbi:hypothetical protein DdX_08277 [Ditylenchus destructor]|uniref:Uncharacterized protein n=1 Tax=Ditylenchus destructor TaxID=166010 RepID=A0AAD4R7A9_9BILA|nr:hypothetical protein DdX_08277 [Ditylenchus destructor]